MSYQRNKDFSLTSPQWRIEHKSTLSECGIPDGVANSDRQWNYVLLHGNDALCTGWEVDWITPQQAKKLIVLLENEKMNDCGYELFRELKKRADS